jgi:hypothetical protein
MACALCGEEDHPLETGEGRTHPLLACGTFALLPQGLLDVIRVLWEWDPQPIPAGDALATWIYDNLHLPGAGPSQRWIACYSHAWGEVRASGEERIHLSVKGHRILGVWSALLRVVPDLPPNTLVQAKHCPVHAAGFRPDTIVVTLRDGPAAARFCDELHALRATNVLTDADFRTVTPPGTAPVPGLTGVSLARQPYPLEDPFGAQLCAVLGSTFDSANRPGRMPELLDFALACLVALKEQGFDLDRLQRRPVWAYL